MDAVLAGARRVVVLGRGALRHRGGRGAAPLRSARARRAGRSARRCRGGPGGRRRGARPRRSRAARGCRSARQEPRHSGRGRDRARRTFGRHPGVGRGGARVPPARGAQSDRRHHRNQRQDHDHAADGRDARGRGRAERERRQRRHGALVASPGRIEPGRTIVCELSSFQLEGVEQFRADVGVLLNVTPDHLDRHGLVRALRGRQAARVRAPARRATRAVLCVDDAYVAALDDADVPGARPPACGSRARELGDVRGRLRGLAPARPAQPRQHGLRDRRRRRALGADEAGAAAALRGFAAPPHRLEQVRELRGVRYVNDSKATNVEATLQALASFEAPLHVILGGSLKGAAFAPLAAPLAHARQRRLPDRRGRRPSCAARSRPGPRARRLRHARARRAPGGLRGAPRATSCCSRRPAPPTTSSGTTSSAGERFRELVEALRVSALRGPGARRRAAARDRRHGARGLRRRHGLLGLGLARAARAPRGLRRARPGGALAAGPARLPAHRGARAEHARGRRPAARARGRDRGASATARSAG